VMPITLRADTSVPILGLNLPRACNDAFSKSTNVKSSATYDIPARRFRRRNSDVIREHPLACTEKQDDGSASALRRSEDLSAGERTRSFRYFNPLATLGFCNTDEVPHSRNVVTCARKGRSV
jgi:hypothetical protein